MDNAKLMVGLVITIGVMALVGVIVLDSLDQASEGTASSIETFNVGNSSVNKTITLDYTPEGDTFTVRYHNGTAWKTIPATDYTLSGKTLTVNATAMY